MEKLDGKLVFISSKPEPFIFYFPNNDAYAYNKALTLDDLEKIAADHEGYILNFIFVYQEVARPEVVDFMTTALPGYVSESLVPASEFLRMLRAHRPRLKEKYGI